MARADLDRSRLDRVHSYRAPVLAVAILFPTVVTWVYFVALRGAPPAVQQGAYTAGKLLQFSLPILWWWFARPPGRRAGWEWITGRGHAPAAAAAAIDVPGTETSQARPADTYGGRGLPWSRGVVTGLVLGAAIAGSMILVYFLVLRPLGTLDAAEGAVRAKVTGIGIDTLAKYVALAVFYSVCHAFLEEYYWRGFVYRELRATRGLGSSIRLSSVGFMLHHVLVLATFFGWSSPATWLFSAGVGIGGAIWAGLYERSRSLSGVWVSHCLVDAAIFAIGFDLLRQGSGR